MIITTTPTIEGRPVKDYLGLVSGEGMSEQPFGITNYGDAILDARHRAISQLRQRAVALGANAVVGITFDLEVEQGKRFVVANGTAVFIP